jgi:hypothetical protein
MGGTYPNTNEAKRKQTQQLKGDSYPKEMVQSILSAHLAAYQFAKNFFQIKLNINFV